jgi:hypothetical protein
MSFAHQRLLTRSGGKTLDFSAYAYAQLRLEILRISSGRHTHRNDNTDQISATEETRLRRFLGRTSLSNAPSSSHDAVRVGEDPRVKPVLVVYRRLSPGSEWRLHRHWFERSALGDLLGADAALADIHTLYACHDRLLEHKEAVFDHLVNRWRDLLNASFDVLLYDLTSTYFESDPPADDEDKRRHGYSRDHRPDCVQVVIALVVTPKGLPLAYEVLAGNTRDCTTLQDFLARIERQYGKARRVWCMDRGVPTEEGLAQMRAADPPVYYLDLAIRPVFHQEERRIEAHIFIAFLAYCLHVGSASN